MPLTAANMPKRKSFKAVFMGLCQKPYNKRLNEQYIGEKLFFLFFYNVYLLASSSRIFASNSLLGG
jgi:hypothetical protein